MRQWKFDVAVVGHQGKMGAFFFEKLQQAGLRVVGIDCRKNNLQAAPMLDIAELSAGVDQARIVLLCVPVTVLKSVISLVAPLLQSGQILSDVTSVKVLPMRWMEAAYAGPVVGTHPLFGPSPDPAAMRVVIVHGSSACYDACQAVEHIFQAIGCSLIQSSAERHDRGVGFAQSLNFAMTASFFAMLAREEEISDFLTPSFTRLMEATRKHLTQDTTMFCEFSAANPFFAEALASYRAVLDEVASGELEKIAREAAVWYQMEAPV